MAIQYTDLLNVTLLIRALQKQNFQFDGKTFMYFLFSIIQFLIFQKFTIGFNLKFIIF